MQVGRLCLEMKSTNVVIQNSQWVSVLEQFLSFEYQTDRFQGMLRSGKLLVFFT